MSQAPLFFPTQRFHPIFRAFGFGRTMEINAREISGLDPGAIPGGSTNLPPGYRRKAKSFLGSMGPISIDRRVKALLSLGLTHRFGSLN